MYDIRMTAVRMASYMNEEPGKNTKCEFPFKHHVKVKPCPDNQDFHN